MVDFDKLIREDARPAPTEPTELFRSLLSADRFSYLRDVQQDVLRAWYEKRDQRDTVLKMSTGAGKTVVGLLMLQSSLNEGVGPALYLSPTVQLVEQVVNDGRDLGVNIVSVTGRGELPVDFDNSEAILCTTFHKLFNARTVFGTSSGTRPIVDVGTLLVDDAHSCLRIAREQTTVKFEAASDVYRQLFTLFSTALRQQSGTKFAELADGYPWTKLPVPHWAWQEGLDDVARILTRAREDDSMKFAWDLFKEELLTCLCFFTGRFLEISPLAVPIRAVPTFAGAKRRLFLSATLADDSILPREFDVEGNAVESTVRPGVSGDVGERMILVPDLIDPNLGPQLPGLMKKLASKFNVVVLVPSKDDANNWASAGAQVAIGNDVTTAVERLRKSKGNFVVLVNRYDGIDLPDDACRVLVVDGLPKGESQFDQYHSSVRRDSLLASARYAQTVEQGFGRGVRSGKDRCVVLITGRELVRFIGTKRHLSLFSPETRAQVEMGRRLSKIASEESTSPQQRLGDLMQKCLNGDEGWRRFHAAEMAAIAPDEVDRLRLKIGTAERRAMNSVYAGDHTAAVEEMRTVANELGNSRPADVGWYLQLGATFLNTADPSAAQEMQKKAHELNSLLLRPVAGVQYRRIASRADAQSERVLAWAAQHSDPNAIVVSISELLTRLTLGTDSERFEDAWQELGGILGATAQRPERDYNKGPDGLWLFPQNNFFLFEAKTEVREDRRSIHQSETEQLSNSVNWFRSEYGSEAQLLPVLIHPTNVLSNSAYPPDGSVALQQDGLERLHQSLTNFAAALAGRTMESWSGSSVGQLLTDHQLTPSQFPTQYCRQFSRSG